MGVIELKGKNALITGGARRIGSAIASRLASKGMNIILHYNSSGAEAHERIIELQRSGVEAWEVSGELSSPDAATALFSRALGCAGSIDLLVNNASIFKDDTILDFTEEEFLEHISINSLAPLALSRELAKQNRTASIVNILDARIVDYDSAHASYHLSKRILADITAMLAIELAPLIRVNGIAPGLILPPPGKDESYIESRKHTNLLVSRGTPEDVADAALFLARAEFVTGQVIYVDGGRHLKGRVYES